MRIEKKIRFFFLVSGVQFPKHAKIAKDLMGIY